jgi:flagellar protein FlbD
MIELTKLNDTKFTVNADLIEFVEETPDTVVSLTTGKKIIVQETRQEVTDLVISYKRAIYTTNL